MSFLMSSSHLFFGLPSGCVNISFHLHAFFFTILSSGIRCKWPAKPAESLCFYVICYILLVLSWMPGHVHIRGNW
jgi:hypothetical protein